MTTFVDRLDDLRKKHDLTITEACELIGVPYATYYNWAHGDSFPRPDGVQKIADAYGVTTAWLMTGKEPQKKESAKAESEQTPVKESVTTEPVKAEIQEPTRTYRIYEHPNKSSSISYSSKDAQALQDVNTVINQIRHMGISREKKKSIHKTMSEIRMNLECKVFYGDDNL